MTTIDHPAPAPSSDPVVASLTEATFDEEIGSSPVPVLVDVWTEWCPPCRAIEPVLASLAADLGDALHVVRVNGEEEPGIVRRFDVMAFPTLLVFDGGRLVHRMVGARGKHHLLEELTPLLG